MLGQNAVVGHRLDVALLEVGLQLDLVDGQDDAGLLQQPGEVGGHEIC